MTEDQRKLTSMQSFTRVRTHHEGTVNAPAERVWQLLLHWGGIMTWWPAIQPPAPLVAAPLADTQAEADLPRTRNCRFDRAQLPPEFASQVPEIVPETLLHVDDVARTLYYNMEGEGPFGLRNYLATTEVDVLDVNTSLVICRGRFDAPVGAPVEVLKAFIESIYEAGILAGFRQFLEPR